MASYRPPETGTLIMSALLLLALAFAGYWIAYYARIGHAPWQLLPWFGAAAITIIVVGVIVFFVRGGGDSNGA